MIILQKPKWEDVLDIQKVIYETWLATYPNDIIGITTEDIKERFRDMHSEKAIQKRIEMLLNIPKNQIFLIAKDGDTVVGVCRAERWEINNQLLAIYVLPSHQRKGVGRIFWKEVQKFFGDKKDIIVHVATYNTQAINFYKKLGFIDEGKRFSDEKFRMPVSGKFIPEMEMVMKFH